MKLKKAFAILLLVALLSGIMLPYTFAEDGSFTISAQLTFGQTEARSMLPLINNLRKPANAWYWDKDNTTKLTAEGLADLTYDYGLEKIAMQRAAEIAVMYSHTRPDGESCFTAYDYDYRAIGENIAWGYNSYMDAEQVFVGWSEANEPYSGQGHRRNMLENSFTGIGIGHVIVGDYHFWVQEFGSPLTGAAYTAPLDGAKKMTVACRSDLVSVSDWQIEPNTAISLTVGGTAALPAVSGHIDLPYRYARLDVRLVSPSFTVSPASVAVVENGKLKGLAAGTAQLKPAGSEFGVSVTVVVSGTGQNTRMPGDVDGDGVLSPADARLALRASVNLEKFEQGTAMFAAADANHNGVIEPEDARMILRASVKLETLTA